MDRVWEPCENPVHVSPKTDGAEGFIPLSQSRSQKPQKSKEVSTDEGNARTVSKGEKGFHSGNLGEISVEKRMVVSCDALRIFYAARSQRGPWPTQSGVAALSVTARMRLANTKSSARQALYQNRTFLSLAARISVWTLDRRKEGGRIQARRTREGSSICLGFRQSG